MIRKQITPGMWCEECYERPAIAIVACGFVFMTLDTKLIAVCNKCLEVLSEKRRFCGKHEETCPNCKTVLYVKGRE